MTQVVEERYLGDGVYASWDGWHVWLDLRAQREGDHVCRIALDQQVFEQLVQFREQALKAQQQET